MGRFGSESPERARRTALEMAGHPAYMAAAARAIINEVETSDARMPVTLRIVDAKREIPMVRTVFDDFVEKITAAIQKTRSFFQSLGVKTCLSQYGVKPEQLPAIAEQLKAHKMTKLGETKDITPDVSLRILQRAM